MKRAATTIGTATAACRPELQDIPWHWSFSDTVGASPVVLVAASAAVPVGEWELVVVGETMSCEGRIEVERVVGGFVALAPLAADGLEEGWAVVELLLDAAVPVAEVPPVVWANSL